MTEEKTSAPQEQAAEPGPHPWAELAAEHFRLLRLAPQTDGRGAPLRFVQLGRVERHSPQQSLLRLSIRLPDQQTRKNQNCLDIWVDHRNKEVRFGPEGGLSVEPPDRGLGRFLMAQGIEWAKKRFSSYAVESQALASKDAFTDEARERRDHFLKALGFEVGYDDALQLKGRCSASHIGVLHGNWNAEKVQFVELLEAAAMLQQADRGIRELETKLRQRDETVAGLKREDGALRFSIACLVIFCSFQAGLLIWMATR